MTTEQSADNLGRLLRPQSIAVLGGSWARSVIEQCKLMGFAGDIWPVHPTLNEVAGLPCFKSVADLPAAPDASFIGINRHLSIDAVKTLAAIGAGGVVCFASGFGEAANEDKDAHALQQQLLLAAGSMPLIGPNCYGLINYLDGALLWPDQHGGERAERGVAFITQSSNIAINLTMQRRALPISYVLTAGNQAQLSIGELGEAIITDERVTALALHIEGFGDIPSFERMAASARALGKPVVAIKVGRSAQARQAMISHTNSLSGSDSAAAAFLHRLGIARLPSLPAMLETLKLLHVIGPLPGNAIQSMSCSGGEASLMADAAINTNLEYPALNAQQQEALREALGPLVALANPLDYHTFIWDDLAAMTATFTAMLRGPADLSLLVLDFPREDRCKFPSWLTALDALIAARDTTGARVGLLASLPENLPESIASGLMQSGVVPLCGIDEAVSAIETAQWLGEALAMPGAAPVLRLDTAASTRRIVDEAQAKQLIQQFGIVTPASRKVDQIGELPAMPGELSFPLALKGRGIAHKTEACAVALNLQTTPELLAAAQQMSDKVIGFLVEEYINDAVAELLVSIVRDATLGFQLTLASGGVLTELLADAVHLLLPVERRDIEAALSSLKIYALLSGYRGRETANISAIVDTVLRLQRFALHNKDTLLEVEINPLLCTPRRAVAADALISLAGENL